MTATIYDQLNALVEAGDKEKALDQLVSYLQEAGKYHELFEALKMRLRTRLGLSAAQAEQESSLDDATELELERGLIDACRQVGELFLKAGKIREGWMYMRPVGNRELAAQALAAGRQVPEPHLAVLTARGGVQPAAIAGRMAAAVATDAAQQGEAHHGVLVPHQGL